MDVRQINFMEVLNMNVKELINVLQNALNSGAFKPDTRIQIDLAENLPETCWSLDVDVSAVSEPKAIIFNIG